MSSTKVLEIRRSNFPDGHIMIVNILTDTDDLHCLRKEFNQAIELHERSDEMRVQLSSPGTPIHKHHLALVYLDTGTQLTPSNFLSSHTRFERSVILKVL
jgi:hypothetical protein